MIKLKQIISNILLESEESRDSNEWDDWREYIEYFEWNIEIPELKKLIKRFNLSGQKYFDGKLIKIGENPPVYLEKESSGNTFSVVDDINQWIYDIDTTDLNIDEESLYNRWVESSLKDLRENPGNVYHYTTDENWEGIQEDEEMVGSYGTGITNRSSNGIFTSVDPEEYVQGTYGDVCLELDLDSFKKDNNLPELDLSFEPDVIEYMIREHVSHILGIELGDDIPSDMSPYTVIVGHTIPTKYIKKYN